MTLSLSYLGSDPATFSGFLYSPVGLAFAYSYYLIPRVVLILLPVLVNFDRAQIAAAESLGASSFRAVMDVLVPQVLPSAVSAYCLVAAVAHRRLRNGAGAGRHPGQHPAPGPVQPDFRHRQRLPVGGGPFGRASGPVHSRAGGGRTFCDEERKP